MSQREFLRSLDATIMGHLKATGLADTGSYSGSAVTAAVDVYVDREVELLGPDGESVAGVHTTVALRLNQVAEPRRGDTVIVDGETFTLHRMIRRDEAETVWVVTDG